MSPEALARLFHETYERLAPRYGYATRPESARAWVDVPEANRRLMTATCREVLRALGEPLAERERLEDRANAAAAALERARDTGTGDIEGLLADYSAACLDLDAYDAEVGERATPTPAAVGAS